MHRAHDSARRHEIAHLKRLQDDQKYSRGKVGQQSAPGQADGHAAGGDQGCQAGGLHPEEAQDGDDQYDVEDGADRILDIANQRGIDLLPGHAAADDPDDKTDQPAADNPQRKGFQHRYAKRDQPVPTRLSSMHPSSFA